MTGVNRDMKHRAFFPANGKEGHVTLLSTRLRLPAAVSTQGGHKYIKERLRFRFTPNGKCEFVPRDQVFPLIAVNSYYYSLKIFS